MELLFGELLFWITTQIRITENIIFKIGCTNDDLANPRLKQQVFS